jgi:hypothetical protein
MVARNTAEKVMVVKRNTDTGQSVNDCRADILTANGL